MSFGQGTEAEVLASRINLRRVRRSGEARVTLRAVVLSSRMEDKVCQDGEDCRRSVFKKKA